MIPSYSDHFKNVMRGFPAQPRGLVVREIYDVHLKFRPGEMPGRKGLNQRIGIMEGFQFIAGIFNPDWIARIAPNAKLELFTEQAAYGPRTAEQLDTAVDVLRVDSFTRRCSITLARPEEIGTSSLPCTTAIQFTLRGGKLFTTVTMRSSDVVWGLPYDVVQFGMLAQTMTAVLGVKPGGAMINIANAHIYHGTQHLVPLDTDGGSFEVKEKLVDWFEAQSWAAEQAERMAAGQPIVGMVIYD